MPRQYVLRPRTGHPEFSKVNGTWDNQGTFTPE